MVFQPLGTGYAAPLPQKHMYVHKVRDVRSCIPW